MQSIRTWQMELSSAELSSAEFATKPLRGAQVEVVKAAKTRLSAGYFHPFPIDS